MCLEPIFCCYKLIYFFCCSLFGCMNSILRFVYISIKSCLYYLLIFPIIYCCYKMEDYEIMDNVIELHDFEDELNQI